MELRGAHAVLGVLEADESAAMVEARGLHGDIEARTRAGSKAVLGRLGTVESACWIPPPERSPSHGHADRIAPEVRG